MLLKVDNKFVETRKILDLVLGLDVWFLDRVAFRMAMFMHSCSYISDVGMLWFRYARFSRV